MPRQNARRGMRLGAQSLAGVEVLVGLPVDVLADVAATAVCVECAPGDEIVHHADQTQDVYLIVSGRVRVNVASAAGRQITFQLLEAGKMFGELSALDCHRRMASVEAEQDTVLARLGQKDFLQLLSRHPGFALATMRRLVAMVRRLSDLVYESHAYNVRGRLCAELLRLSEGVDGAVVAVVDRDMASRVGTTREHVTKLIGELKREGLVERRGKSVVVHDTAGLRQTMEGSALA